ncbi:hypothetical protein S245_020243, partial [Arachis hypogaea]
YSISVNTTTTISKERSAISTRSQFFPIQITGWPLDLMAYAYLAVSPPSMIARSEEMAAAASNKSTAKKDLRYPEIEEQALCESSISKYNNNL